MTGKRFLYPWQKDYPVYCPKCGGKIISRPLWHWEVEGEQALQELQPKFCHVLDSAFLNKVRVLSANDWKSHQALKAFELELDSKTSAMKAELLKEGDGVIAIVGRFGVFSLVSSLTGKEFETLLLLLTLPPLGLMNGCYICQAMSISPAHLSGIFKKFRKFGVLQSIPGKKLPEVTVKGRSRGRILYHRIAPNAREVLDKDLQNYDFFKDSIIQTIISLREKDPMALLRNDLEIENHKNRPPP